MVNLQMSGKGCREDEFDSKDMDSPVPVVSLFCTTVGDAFVDGGSIGWPYLSKEKSTMT